MDVVLVAVRQSVIIGVEVDRVSSQLDLDRVLQTVAVAVTRCANRAGRRRLLDGTLFDRGSLLGRSCGQTIERIGALRDLVSVQNAVAVGVCAQRRRAYDVDLLAVCEPIFVGVGQVRIGTGLVFRGVGQTVLVVISIIANRLPSRFGRRR